MVREWKTASRTLNDFNCEWEEDSWLVIARRNCRGGWDFFIMGSDPIVSKHFVYFVYFVVRQQTELATHEGD